MKYKADWFATNCEALWHAELNKANQKILNSQVIVNNMDEFNLSEKFSQLIMSEPDKTYRKLGIKGVRNHLTNDGLILFVEFLLTKFGDEFKKEVCDKLLADQEKK